MTNILVNGRNVHQNAFRYQMWTPGHIRGMQIMSKVGTVGAGTTDGDLTILLQAYAQGDQRAWHALIDRVYLELRSIASGRLRDETHNELMGPTALINEAYIRLVSGNVAAKWVNRRHFFAAASETMRRILVDQARQRLTSKRGG